jgi:hypothetical protein
MSRTRKQNNLYAVLRTAGDHLPQFTGADMRRAAERARRRAMRAKREKRIK